MVKWENGYTDREDLHVNDSITEDEITFEEGNPSWMQDEEEQQPVERGVFPGIKRVVGNKNWEFREKELLFDPIQVSLYEIDSKGNVRPVDTAAQPKIYVSAKDAHILDNKDVLKHIYNAYGNILGIITTEESNPKVKNVMTRKIVLGTLK